MKDCSSYMGGIDKADMSCSIYGVGRKSNKWWQPIMLYTRVNEGDVKSVQKEVFSQDHIVNATCVMFF